MNFKRIDNYEEKMQAREAMLFRFEDLMALSDKEVRKNITLRTSQDGFVGLPFYDVLLNSHNYYNENSKKLNIPFSVSKDIVSYMRLFNNRLMKKETCDYLQKSSPESLIYDLLEKKYCF